MATIGHLLPASLDEDQRSYLEACLADCADSTVDDLTELLEPFVDSDAANLARQIHDLKVSPVESSASQDARRPVCIKDTAPPVTTGSPPKDTPESGKHKSSRRKKLEKEQRKREAKNRTVAGALEKQGAPNSVGVIEAHAEVSRFRWEESMDERQSQDVDLRNLSITVAGKDLLVGARLHLMADRRYGLIGRNGIGKTMLLSQMAGGNLIGYPTHVSTMLVSQEAEPDKRSPIQTVVDSDAELVQYRREEKELQTAIAAGAAEAARVCKAIAVQRTRAEAYEARRIANKRSRMRGKIARDAARTAEHLAALVEKGSEAPEDDSLDNDLGVDISPEERARAEQVLAWTPEELLEEVQNQLLEKDSETAEARAETILKGLQFDDALLAKPTEALSGGWRMRVALAQALFCRPQVLLLDEPTNHLDLHATLWLEQHLLTELSGRCVVIVSHDRAFLDSVVTDIFHFAHQTITHHAGNYEDFELRTADLTLKRQRMFEAQERMRARLAETAERMRTAARKSGDDKMARQASVRQKKLEERVGTDKLEDGRRFKLSYHGVRAVGLGMTGAHEQKRFTVSAPQQEIPPKLTLPPVENLGTYGSVLQLDDVEVGYVKNKPVLKSCRMDVSLTGRIALVGKNGAGKSTLMHLLHGDLRPWRGEVNRHHNLRVELFDQHCIEQLDPAKTPLQLVAELAKPSASENDLRGHLAGVGLSGTITTRPCSTLSGGQKARCALALMTYKKPQILLLDEPSNHLDHDTIDALAEAINDFEGGVVLASHDQRLVASVEGVEVYVVAKGEVKFWDGEFGSYVQRLRARIQRNFASA